MCVRVCNSSRLNEMGVAAELKKTNREIPKGATQLPGRGVGMEACHRFIFVVNHGHLTDMSQKGRKRSHQHEKYVTRL